MSQVLAGEYLLRSVSVALSEAAIVSSDAKHHKPQQFSEKRRAEARLHLFLVADCGSDQISSESIDDSDSKSVSASVSSLTATGISRDLPAC